MFPPVYQRLVNDPDVFAYVGARVYPHGEAPERVIAPYVTWFVGGGAPENQLDGAPGVDAYVVTVRVWSGAESGIDVYPIGEAVRDALEAVGFMEDVPTTGRDTETRRYYLMMIFRIWVTRERLSSSLVS